MCVTCGCSTGAKVSVLNLQTGETSALEHEHTDGTGHSHPHGHGHDHDHEHVHDDGTRHTHSHGHGDDHDHAHGHAHSHSHNDGTRHSHHHHHDHGHAHASEQPQHVHGTIVDLEARVLAKNDALADRNRAWLAGREILMLNLVSSPGAGKTTLLERTIRDLKGKFPIFVVEGDQATANDARRIKDAGAPVVQVNTGTGCHLEADMVARGLDELRPSVGSMVLVENVGNLVCPALFDLGEAAKVAILSVAEGDDKPAKYPHMFAAAALVIINKIDLLPHVDFSVEKAVTHAREVNPAVEIVTVSARTGEGLDGWYNWLAARRVAAGAKTGL